MKQLIPLFAVLALWGCVTVPQNVQLPAGQALLVAEAGMDGANHAATVAATSGFLKGSNAATVKASIDAGNNAVSAAHTLYSKGDLVGTVSQLNTAMSDIASIQSASKPAVTP